MLWIYGACESLALENPFSSVLAGYAVFTFDWAVTVGRHVEIPSDSTEIDPVVVGS